MHNKVARLFVYVYNNFHSVHDLFANSEIILGHLDFGAENVIRIRSRWIAPYQCKIQHISTPTANLLFLIDAIESQKDHARGDLTHINQKRVEEGTMLQIGDVIHIGLSVIRIIVADANASLQDIEDNKYLPQPPPPHQDQKIIRGNTITELIESNTVYKGCTFYCTKEEIIANSVFDNCSFREDIIIKVLWNCKFIDCSFREFTIYNAVHSMVNGEAMYRYHMSLKRRK